MKRLPKISNEELIFGGIILIIASIFIFRIFNLQITAIILSVIFGFITLIFWSAVYQSWKKQSKGGDVIKAIFVTIAFIAIIIFTISNWQNL